MSQRHLAYLAVPAAGFIATPYLPFADTPQLWLGLPAVLVWCVFWTVATTVALYLYEIRAPHPEDAVHTADAEGVNGAAGEGAAR